jgi:hypothetical protein
VILNEELQAILTELQAIMIKDYRHTWLGITVYTD